MDFVFESIAFVAVQDGLKWGAFRRDFVFGVTVVTFVFLLLYYQAKANLLEDQKFNITMLEMLKKLALGLLLQ